MTSLVASQQRIRKIRHLLQVGRCGFFWPNELDERSHNQEHCGSLSLNDGLGCEMIWHLTSELTHPEQSIHQFHLLQKSFIKSGAFIVGARRTWRSQRHLARWVSKPMGFCFLKKVGGQTAEPWRKKGRKLSNMGKYLKKWLTRRSSNCLRLARFQAPRGRANVLWRAQWHLAEIDSINCNLHI